MSRVAADRLYSPAGFCCVRTPLLPLEVLAEWAELGRGLAADEAERRLAARARELAADPLVGEALYLASPSLYQALGAGDGAPRPKVTRALVRYLFRMASRPTPFGLCAGYSVVPIAGETRLAIAGRSAHRKEVRLDVGFVARLCDELLADERLREVVPVRANSSVTARAGELAFTCAGAGAGNRPAFEQLSCDDSDEIRAVLERAREPATLSALASDLAGRLELDPEDVRELVDAMAEAGLLEPELQPTVDGAEPFEHVAAVCSAAAPELAAPLAAIRSTLGELETRLPGDSVAGYQAAAAELAALAPAAADAVGFLVNLQKPAPSASLDRRVADRVLAGVEILRRVCRFSDPLEPYRQAMETRFEARSWEIRETVPLSEALDPELGLIPRSGRSDEPLLRGIPLSRPSAERQVVWGPREQALLSLVTEAARSGAREVELDDGDIDALAVDRPLPLPDAFAAQISLVPGERGQRIYIAMVEGPSGARSLGRLCHGDPELAALVREHVRAEEALRPAARFAEVAHLPVPRAGNVVSRPSFRDHVIPLLGHTTAPAAGQIHVDELELALVDDGGGDARLALVCPRLGSEVIPRLTAHPRYWTSDQLALYNFLGTMQGHGTASYLAFDWGPVGGAPFLPRLCYGDLILAPARWNVGPSETRRLAEILGGRDAAALADERARRGWPRWLALDQPGSPMLVDLENPLSRAALADSLEPGAPAAFFEPLYARPGVVSSPEGSFAHELIIPFVRSRPSITSRPAVVASAAARRCPPGSDWLDARLEGDPILLDRLARERLPALVESALGEDGVERFYFVRGFFPRGHLRLRFGGEPAALSGRVLPAIEALAAELIAAGELDRLDLATFVPEVARYGGDAGLAAAEALFTADSRWSLQALARLDDDLEARWRFALLSADRLLDSFGLDRGDKLELVSRFGGRLAAEFGELPPRDHAIGRRFRAHRRELERLLDGELPLPGDLVEILAARSAAIAAPVARLRAIAAAGTLSVELSEVFRNLLHMHANRLLASSPRAQELVIYDFLGRLYRSQRARERHRSK